MTRVRVLCSRLLDLLFRGAATRRLDGGDPDASRPAHRSDYVARGLSPADAGARRRREFGGVDQIQAAYRDQRGLPLLDTLAQDVRFAVRLLRRDRAFSLTAVLVLGARHRREQHAVHDPERPYDSRPANS